MTKIINLLAILLALFDVGAAQFQEENDRLDYVEKLNDLRRYMAVMKNIADFRMLDWSDTLVKQIESMPHNCTAFQAPTSTRFYPFGGNSDAEEYESVLRENFVKYGFEEVKQWFTKTGFFLEPLQPQISAIGCAPFECEYHLKVENKMLNLKYSHVCLVAETGTHLNLNGAPGEPGSQCDAHHVNVAGLCKKKHDD